MGKMKYLLTTVETYRVDSEENAAALIEQAKNERGFALIKYNCEHKERKAKNEVVDS